MTLERNPYLEPENFFKGYQDKIEELKNKPEVVMFDRMCYELFEMTEMGQRFIKYAQEFILIPAMARRGTSTYQLDLMWAEGYKDAYRDILRHIISHRQRIAAEKSKHVGS